MKRAFQKILIILTFAPILCLCQISTAQTADEHFMLGNNAYKNGDFARAKENYQNALKSSTPTAELYYNLANTNAKLGKRGEALLDYMRAIYESPRMPEAHANLKMFAKDTSIDLPQKTQIEELLSELSESEWTTIGFIAFWAAVLLIFIPPLYSGNNMATVFLAIISTSVFVVAIVAVFDWQAYAQTAISVVDNAELKLSPTDTAPVSSIATEGQMASILKRHGDYVYLETKNGKRGWASTKDFIPIVE